MTLAELYAAAGDPPTPLGAVIYREALSHSFSIEAFRGRAPASPARIFVSAVRRLDDGERIEDAEELTEVLALCAPSPLDPASAREALEQLVRARLPHLLEQIGPIRAGWRMIRRWNLEALLLEASSGTWAVLWSTDE